MRWKLPTLALAVVVLLAGGGTVVGLAAGGAAGAVIGGVAGALAGVAAGYVPMLQDRARQRQEALEQARRRLAAASEPLLEDANAGPSLLLRPERTVVGFIGREAELALLRAWCASREPWSVRVVVGAGGVGKTRLALELAAEWEAAGGRVVQVAAGAEADVLARARAVTAGPVLVVADYAETRAGLGVLLRAVLDDPGRVRVLLLARSLGEWWDRLAEESAPAVARLLAAADPVLLDAPVADVPDAVLAAVAVQCFAEKVGVPEPEGVVFDLPPYRVPVLVLHAAALVAVLRSQSNPPGGPRVAVTSGVLDELLEHEARYWRRSATTSGLGADGRVLKMVVAALVLLGADDVEQAAAAAGRVPDLAGVPGGELRRWGWWLSGLYPGGMDGRLGSVQPDLLAEHHAVTQLAGDPSLARAVLSELDARQAVQALTVLGRAWELHQEAGTVIEAALSADLAGLAVPATNVAIQTQARVGPLLAAALDSAPIVLKDLVRIEEGLPYPSVALASAHLAVAQRIRRELPPSTSRQDTARWASRCGVLLSQAGRPADALSHTQEAVALYRELADAMPERFRPGLADSLSNLGVWFSELGRSAEALPLTEEAVALYRELAAAMPDRFRPGLADALSNLSNRFSELGRLAEALPPVEEVVALYRELAAAMPDRFRPGLAMALSNLGVAFSDLGRPVDALPPTEEAVAIRRELAAAMPDRFRPGLAMALSNLGATFSDLGRPVDALPPTEEAVATYRELAAAVPDRYRPYLATALTGLGVRFSALGRPADALPAEQEAMAIRRELAAAMPDRFLVDLADSLANLGVTFSELSRPADALPLEQEAVALYRELAAALPERYRPDLAIALSNLGDRLSELGRPAEALPLTQEAVATYRELAAAMPDRFRAGLAIALINLGVAFSELSRPADALPLTEEAVTIRRELATDLPDRFRPDLARSLSNLGDVLSALGRTDDAAAARREADEYR